MDVNSISSQILGNTRLDAKTINEKQVEYKPEEKSPLDYYHDLCKEFPDVTFRLEDYGESEKHPDKIVLGYQDSFNQVGNNFSELNQVSIEIDVAVIEHMQRDSKYAEQVHGEIEYTIQNYSTFRRWATEEGMTHMERELRDGPSRVETGLCMHKGRASTEEEVRAMWNMSGSKKTLTDKEIQKKLASMKNDMLDCFMEMTQSHNKHTYVGRK